MENSYRLPVASYGRMELAQIYFPHICGRAECIFRNLGVPTRMPSIAK